MKIAILGYGKEGKAAEAYFRAHPDEQGRENEIEVISPFEAENATRSDFEEFDLLVRSPSVPPLRFWGTGVKQRSDAEFSTRSLEEPNAESGTRSLYDAGAKPDMRSDDDFASLEPKMTSGTRYFFNHCSAPIIGVTGTKGKGTTCSIIAALLRALGRKVFLVGNIGVPALNELDKIKKDDVVVYEMSSFQLWDAEKSPHIAVILRLEPDHLNVHKDFEDYLEAKGRIAEYQGSEDSVIYFAKNENSQREAMRGQGRKVAYPIENAESDTRSLDGLEVEQGSEQGADAEKNTRLVQLLDNLTVPGEHNRENAEAALLAVAEFLGVSLDELIEKKYDKLAAALRDFQGLPHHIEFVRNLHGVDYYDDSFATNEPSLEVALKSFQGRPLVLIAGGQDKGVDYAPIKEMIFGTPGLARVILIGEISEQLAAGEEKAQVVKTLEEAVKKAQEVAEEIATEAEQGSEQRLDAENSTRLLDELDAESGTRSLGGPVVLLSPGAASLDMFESYYQRGDLFKEYVRELK